MLWLATSQSASDGRRSTSATSRMKPLGEARRIAVARKLPFISEGAAHVKSLTRRRRMAAARKLTFISEATAHVNILTRGRMVAVARNLAVLIRWAPLDIRCHTSHYPGQAWGAATGWAVDRNRTVHDLAMISIGRTRLINKPKKQETKSTSTAGQVMPITG